EYPDDQRRLALVAVEHVEDREEHLLRDVLGLGDIPQALQREAVDPGEVGLVEHLERVSIAGQDLRYELGITGPRMLGFRQDVLLRLASPLGGKEPANSSRSASGLEGEPGRRNGLRPGFGSRSRGGGLFGSSLGTCARTVNFSRVGPRGPARITASAV